MPEPVQTNSPMPMAPVSPEHDPASMSLEGAAPVQLPAPVDQIQPEPDLAENEPEESPLTWQASEYVHHHKGTLWYLGLGGVLVVLVVLAWVFQLWLSIGVFVAMGVAIVVYAHRPPRVLTYELDSTGVMIEGKHYAYDKFRSYGVVSDADWHSIDLEPVQRFMPRLTMLFGDDDYDAIVEHLALHLPRVDHEPDMIERLSRYLRF